MRWLVLLLVLVLLLLGLLRWGYIAEGGSVTLSWHLSTPEPLAPHHIEQPTIQVPIHPTHSLSHTLTHSLLPGEAATLWRRVSTRVGAEICRVRTSGRMSPLTECCPCRVAALLR